MDDVTVDVNQYTEEDSVILSSKPNFAMASKTIELPLTEEENEEDYELKPEDAPAFSTKSAISFPSSSWSWSLLLVQSCLLFDEVPSV